jgi:hypothetical protein
VHQLHASSRCQVSSESPARAAPHYAPPSSCERHSRPPSLGSAQIAWQTMSMARSWQCNKQASPRDTCKRLQSESPNTRQALFTLSPKALSAHPVGCQCLRHHKLVQCDVSVQCESMSFPKVGCTVCTVQGLVCSHGTCSRHKAAVQVCFQQRLRWLMNQLLTCCIARPVVDSSTSFSTSCAASLCQPSESPAETHDPAPT